MGDQNNQNKNNGGDLLKVRRDKLAELQAAGNDPYMVNTSSRDTLNKDIADNFEELEGKTVTIAGRIMSKRGKGKVMFMDLYDRTGKMQIFAKFDDLGEDTYKGLKKWDIGDIMECTGFVFKTKMGEVSVHATGVKLLSKSLLPLPEKYHGLKDVDLRYRQREVDLIMNPEVKETFVKRSKIVSTIRNIMDSKDFVEIETPVAPCTGYELSKEVVIVPILRAGIGLLDGIRRLVPTAKVGFIGMYRDEETLIPHEYFAKFPKNLEDAIVMVVDPMLATGGSAVDAISAVKSRGAKQIKLVCLVGAPEGVKAVTEAHPDVDVYLAALDDHLNEHGYIVPGLGDAGDRIFGTK